MSLLLLKEKFACETEGKRNKQVLSSNTGDIELNTVNFIVSALGQSNLKCPCIMFTSAIIKNLNSL